MPKHKVKLFITYREFELQVCKTDFSGFDEDDPKVYPSEFNPDFNYFDNLSVEDFDYGRMALEAPYDLGADSRVRDIFGRDHTPNNNSVRIIGMRSGASVEYSVTDENGLECDSGQVNGDDLILLGPSELNDAKRDKDPFYIVTRDGEGYYVPKTNEEMFFVNGDYPVLGFKVDDNLINNVTKYAKSLDSTDLEFNHPIGDFFESFLGSRKLKKFKFAPDTYIAFFRGSDYKHYEDTAVVEFEIDGEFNISKLTRIGGEIYINGAEIDGLTEERTTTPFNEEICDLAYDGKPLLVCDNISDRAENFDVFQLVIFHIEEDGTIVRDARMCENEYCCDVNPNFSNDLRKVVYKVRNIKTE